MKKSQFVIRISIMLIFLFVIVGCKSQETQVAERGIKLSGGRAISLKVLQEKVRDCMTKGTCSQDTLQLCGIKKITGYVIDEKSRDLILIGNIDDSAPPLYLEDFIIALRNVWLKYAELKGNTYYYTNPGCSIDPDAGILRDLDNISRQIFRNSNPDIVQGNLKQWHRACGQPQRVRVLGIPYDSRFGQIMVEADYYMKRLVDGSVKLDIAGFTSLSEMTLNIAKSDIEENKRISIPVSALNRFWFYPGKNTFLEDKGLIYIEKSDVQLLTEEQYLPKKGGVRGTGKANNLADEFAKTFSEKYSEIAKIKPIYRELEGLFRFVALTRIMKHKDALSKAGMNAEYYLDKYPVTITPVSRTVAGLSNIMDYKHKSITNDGSLTRYLWLPSCGGVSIDSSIKDSDIAMDKTGIIIKLEKAVLTSRPSYDALFWNY